MRSCFGLTLIELLVGLSLLAVIFIFSISSFNSIVKKNQLEMRVDEITHIIHYARARAIIEGSPMILKPLNNDKDWSYGLKLIQGGTKAHQIDKVIVDQVWRWKSSPIKMSWHGFISDNYLVFSPNVRSNALNGTFKVTLKNKTYKLTLNRLARIKKQLSE